MAVSIANPGSTSSSWPWRVGSVVESPELAKELSQAFRRAGISPVFSIPASLDPFDVGQTVERENADVLFVEFALAPRPAAEWMSDVRRGRETPLVIAVHCSADPPSMIEALRAGASEFLYPPIQAAFDEALDRVGALVESRRSASAARGRIIGLLSAKGGCGATSMACHLSAAIRAANTSARILVADFDHQCPGAHQILRVGATASTADAFAAVRRLNPHSWREIVAPAAPGIDLLAAPQSLPETLPDEWRVENLFRFVLRNYDWVLADLGRNLNPSNWIFLQHLDELYVVTQPDVLALYQTRCVLQTLSSRGFEKNRVKIALNHTFAAPHDFWAESIEQMFEIGVSAFVPYDPQTLAKLPRDRFEFPAQSPFGRALTKFAGRISGSALRSAA